MLVFTIEHDTYCGLHSGIPQCCVTFYTTTWNRTFPGYEFRNSYWDLIKAKEERTQTRAAYIPCPRCVYDDEPFSRITNCMCGYEKVTGRFDYKSNTILLRQR